MLILARAFRSCRRNILIRSRVAVMSTLQDFHLPAAWGHEAIEPEVVNLWLKLSWLPSCIITTFRGWLSLPYDISLWAEHL